MRSKNWHNGATAKEQLAVGKAWNIELSWKYMIEYHTGKSGKIAEVLRDSVKGADTDDILQLMVDAGYTHSVQSMIIHAESLPPDFFDLKSGVAGEILQKFSNYRMKLAIVGDFSEIKSKSLRDFIRESNDRKIISFVSTVNEALSVLDK